MKESDKKRLQLNFRELVNNIMVSDIQDFLYEKDVINAENLEALTNEKSPQRAARYLVGSILPKKGPQAFETFCEALREGGYEHLAETLVNTKIEKIPQIGASSVTAEHAQHSRNRLQQGQQTGVKVRKAEQPRSSTKQRQTEETVESKFQNVCLCEDRVTTSRQMDKEKIEQLEFENFKLKKQLSFYEENTDAYQQQKSDSVRKRRVRSQSACVPEGHVQQASTTSLDSGLSDMEDIQVDMDEAFDNVDGLGEHGGTARTSEYDATATSSEYDGTARSSEYDGTAKLGEYCGTARSGEYEGTARSSEYDGTAGSDECSTVRTVITSRFQTQDFENQDDEDDLINVLVTDIVDSMYRGSETNPCLYRSHHSQYVFALRKAVQMVITKHHDIFHKISKKVDLNATWKEINEQMAGLYNQLLHQEFYREAITWGKILALFCLTGYVAKRCARKDKVVLPLSEFLEAYIKRKLERKIEKIGGWVSCHLSHINLP